MSIAAIQIKRKELGLSEVRYRAVLREVAGVDSARLLDVKGDKAVYRTLCDMGRAHSKAARYVWVLWGQLQAYLPARERSGAYLVGIIRRCTASDLSDLSELSDLSSGELHKVIEALKRRLDDERAKLAQEVPF